ARQLAHRAHGPRRQRRRRVDTAARRCGYCPGRRAMRNDVWLVILGMAAATYLTRAPMFLALARRPLPPRVRLWLRLVPLAVLPALAVPLVLVRDGRLALAWTNPPLCGPAPLSLPPAPPA